MKPRSLCALLAAVTIGPATASAQSSGVFDVASIRRNLSGGDGTTINTSPGGRFDATNVSLKTLIESAYGVKDFQIAGGPRWLDGDAYDISARANSAGQINDNDLKSLLQSLLEDRFRLKVHREAREVSLYSLVIAKTGSKLKEHAGPGGPSGGTLRGSGKVTMNAVKVPVAMLVENLGRVVGRTVVDNTGLTALYDFRLEWAADQTADASGPSLFTALQEQLGLKLDSTHSPVETIVIDNAEKASEN